jgi:poly(3-hydroxybutyrate) depolymerase
LRLDVRKLGAFSLLYHLYELAHAALSPARAAADSAKFLFRNPLNPLAHTSVGRSTAAAAELVERTTRRYKKPNFGIFGTTVNGRSVGVQENIVWQKPFCRLVHFRRDLPAQEIADSPRVLIVAPLSGHFATLLRGTVEGMLPSHEVYITDWCDARAVAASRGKFDLDDYVDYVIEMVRLFHGDVHVMAVCQPSVPVLIAVSHMEAERDPEAPRSITLMGGPVDTRLSPTAVNELAKEKGTDWFKRNVITTVPWPHAGHGRQVYPGFLQLTGFMSMNLDRHLNAHKELFVNLVKGDGDSAEKHREFYDEYLAVMDLTAEYYLQTIDRVFVQHALPRGEMTYRGKRVDPSAVRRVALMTVEGEKDDITGIGQCQAAHTICCNLSHGMRKHHLQPGVGHYGIFNGSRFRSDIVPQIATFLRRHDPRGVGRVRRIFKAMFDPRRVEAAPEPITVREVTLTKVFPVSLTNRPKVNGDNENAPAAIQHPPLGLVGTVPQITHNRPVRAASSGRKS